MNNFLRKGFHPLKYNKKVIINNKSFHMEWTEQAEQELYKRNKPLIIEMGFYFSCLVKKFVNFHESYKKTTESNNLHPVTNKMSVWFHPVISSICEIGERQYKFQTVDVKLENLNNYYPKKLRIDFNNGQWEGYFL